MKAGCFILAARLALWLPALAAAEAELPPPVGDAAALPTESPSPPAESPPPPEPAPPPAPAVSDPGQQRQNLLNPAISAVFQLIGDTSLSREDEANGFDLSEAEVALQAVVDPYVRMDLFLTFPADESPEVEEGFVTTLGLAGPLQLKGGRFKSALGKWNLLHTHAFFTVERPDSLAEFLGDESLTVDGLSLNVLIPNPWDLYMESISEIGTAREGVSFNSVERNLTWLQHLSLFLDTTPSSTLEIGLTASGGRVGPTDGVTGDIEDAGLSDILDPDPERPSAVYGLDLTYKWKPLQFNVYRSFTWQTELLRSRRHVQELTPAESLESGTISSLGGYSYLEYQYLKRWRVGMRYDRFGSPQDRDAQQWTASAVLRFQVSEFQELRWQFKHLRRNSVAAADFDGFADDSRILLQWIPIIGAHGAHRY